MCECRVCLTEGADVIDEGVSETALSESTKSNKHISMWAVDESGFFTWKYCIRLVKTLVGLAIT